MASNPTSAELHAGLARAAEARQRRVARQRASLGQRRRAQGGRRSRVLVLLERRLQRPLELLHLRQRLRGEGDGG
eukprot:1001759-Prymnesium_polylepis.1